MPFIEVAGQHLEYLRLPARRTGRPPLVFLHEGLGSVAMWRDFPTQVAEATGCGVLVWSRLGYGDSDPLPGRRTARYMHDEAWLGLPRLLRVLDIERPILVGHSDGGSIALLHAAHDADSVAGVVALAPHEFVEDKALEGIRRAGEIYATTDWPQRLARFHRDPDTVFRAWHDIWLAPEFRTWDITDCLPRITCPLLALQGCDDEYATMRQIDCIAERAPDVELLALANCRHSPHRDQPQAVIAAITRFVDRLAAGAVIADDGPPARARIEPARCD
ncbi:alpha/beta hydrolase [Accumulibacter sp.]|uniref:alpha/beta fold hydrolase n=1 Tax=Accumulibacter sp. TaxID=2053492 RepID=UPI00261C43FA|nr:alpha/beta hydrolase [Accumulibacter sp.]